MSLKTTINFSVYVPVLFCFNYLIQVAFGFPRFVTDVNFDSFEMLVKF